MNLLKNRAHRASLALGLILAAPFAAFAQSSDPFTTAVTDATTKVGTYGAALVLLAAAGVVFSIAIKYVKRIPRAS